MKFSLTTILLASGLVAAAPAADLEPLFSRQAAQSIHDAMVRKGKKYFGTATDPNRFNTGSNGAIIKANFGQVTPENRYTYHSLSRVPSYQIIPASDPNLSC